MSKSTSIRLSKRRHSEDASNSLESVPNHRGSKRRKPTDRPQQTHQTHWDRLSTVYLTANALKELNRRTADTKVIHPELRPRYHRSSRRRTQCQTRAGKAIAQLCKLDAHCQECEELRRLSRHGGPDLTEIRGFSQEVRLDAASMPSDQSSSRFRGRRREESSASAATPSTAATTIRSKSSGAYDRNFEQILIDHGVYPLEYEFPDGKTLPLPDNWDEITERLSRRRASLSPTRFASEHFSEFKRADARAAKKDQVRTSVIPYFKGRTCNLRCESGGVPWNNLDPLTSARLTPAKPDMYEGALSEQLDPEVRHEISKHVAPSTQSTLPILPNFTLEAKGPDGTAAVVERQAIYNGALGARAMRAALSYGQETASADSSAHIISATYQAGQLKLCTTHVAIVESRPVYIRHQIGTWAMTGRGTEFCLGAAAFRNARDWTREQRDIAIAHANEAVRKIRNSMLVSEPIGAADNADQQAEPSSDEAYETAEGEEEEEEEEAPTLSSFAATSDDQDRRYRADESTTTAEDYPRSKRQLSISPRASRMKRRN